MGVVSIHQLWAQAYALFQQGQSFKLSDPEIAMRDVFNGSYEIEDVYESRVAGYLQHPCWGGSY